MGVHPAALIVILVFGVLFSILFVSQAVRRTTVATAIDTRPALTEDAATSIAKVDLEKRVAPSHLDNIVLFPKYYGHPLSLIFIHNNETQYYINSTNGYRIYDTCIGCEFSDVIDELKGHLFYVVDGSWRDSSIKNCSPFIYTVDAKSGVILWSYVGDVKDMGCQVQPPDW